MYRPGGSALNSGQVGSTRAAQYIAANYGDKPLAIDEFVKRCTSMIQKKITLGRSFLDSLSKDNNLINMRRELGKKMSTYGAHIRNLKEIIKAAEEIKENFDKISEYSKLSTIYELPYAFQNYDLYLSAYIYLSAMADYINYGGKSRGSYLIVEDIHQASFRNMVQKPEANLDDGALNKRIQTVQYLKGQCIFQWEDVRPVPLEDSWFENVWKAYRNNQIYE